MHRWIQGCLLLVFFLGRIPFTQAVVLPLPLNSSSRQVLNQYFGEAMSFPSMISGFDPLKPFDLRLGIQMNLAGLRELNHSNQSDPDFIASGNVPYQVPWPQFYASFRISNGLWAEIGILPPLLYGYSGFGLGFAQELAHFQNFQSKILIKVNFQRSQWFEKIRFEATAFSLQLDKKLNQADMTFSIFTSILSIENQILPEENSQILQGLQRSAKLGAMLNFGQYLPFSIHASWQPEALSAGVMLYLLL